jgi:hypothetical protein
MVVKCLFSRAYIVRRLMRVYRINAVNEDGRSVVLETTDTASHALAHVRQALADHPRAWVTDDRDMDVDLAELARLAEEENGHA